MAQPAAGQNRNAQASTIPLVDIGSTSPPKDTMKNARHAGGIERSQSRIRAQIEATVIPAMPTRTTETNKSKPTIPAAPAGFNGIETLMPANTALRPAPAR